jgi:hypothetical protein
MALLPVKKLLWNESWEEHSYSCPSPYVLLEMYSKDPYMSFDGFT